ncbi:MAG: F0F1 ATP synthase subunit B [Phycisphaerae bacterium]|nr:F0F1 ATP synthase subunit B [Phycisphaerae bacterium]
MAKTALFCAAVAMLLLSCGVAWAEQSAEPEAGGAGLFSGSFGDSIWTVVAFVLLLVVLGKFAWRPLLDGLNARQSHIEQQLKSAEDSRVQAEHLLDDYRHQGLTLVQQATEQAQRCQQQMAEQAREESQAIRRRTHEEIASARATALEDLWKQTGEIVLQVGSEVLGRKLTEQDNQRLIDEAVARVRQNGGGS